MEISILKSLLNEASIAAKKDPNFQIELDTLCPAHRVTSFAAQIDHKFAQVNQNVPSLCCALFNKRQIKTSSDLVAGLRNTHAHWDERSVTLNIPCLNDLFSMINTFCPGFLADFTRSLLTVGKAPLIVPTNYGRTVADLNIIILPQGSACIVVSQ